MLDLGPDASRDVVGQLVGGALKTVNHLLELADQGVPCLLVSLLSVLQMGLQLLDVCDREKKKSSGHRIIVPHRQTHRKHTDIRQYRDNHNFTIILV